MILAASGRDPDLAPFVGSAHLGECLLVWPRHGAPLLGFFVDMERDEAAATGFELLGPRELARKTGSPAGSSPAAARTETERWCRAVLAALASREVVAGPLALAGRLPAALAYELGSALSRAGYSCHDGRPAVLAARKTKTSSELAAIRASARGACAAFERTARCLADARIGAHGDLVHRNEPLRVGRLRREIAVELARHGLEQPHGNIVACGPEAGVPHSAGEDERVVRAGEAVLVDLFPAAGLFADCTRTFCVGTPPDELAAAHALCRQVLEDVVASASSGIQGFALHELACDRFEAAGHETGRSHAGTRVGYVHGLGHGVGYELHEPPTFRDPERFEQPFPEAARLEPGDVITLEPGLYDPDRGWGVRLEDLFLVSAEGLETLTPLPYALDPSAWDR